MKSGNLTALLQGASTRPFIIWLSLVTSMGMGLPEGPADAQEWQGPLPFAQLAAHIGPDPDPFSWNDAEWTKPSIRPLTLALTSSERPNHADAQTSGEQESTNGRTSRTNEESERQRSPKNLIALAMGAGYWPNLHKVQPDPSVFDPNVFGRPNAWGINIELTYHRQIAHWRNKDLFLGADLGFLNNENEKTFQERDMDSKTTRTVREARLLSQLIYLTPSAKLMFGQPRSWRWFAGGGLGLYGLELAAKDEFGVEVERFAEKKVKKQAFGGYVSIGTDIPVFRSQSGWEFRLRLEDKLHYVNFGDLGQFAPGSGDLAGPINMMQLGFVAGF